MTLPRFTWADAWFLTALGAAGPGRVSLARLIGAADAINHAIVTREELNGAIGRLGAAGYVRWHETGEVELTESGAALVAETGRRASRRRQDERIEKRLGAEPWSPSYDPGRAGDGAADVVSQAMYDAAADAYLGRKRR